MPTRDCPPCTGDCNQGRMCPTRRATTEPGELAPPRESRPLPGSGIVTAVILVLCAWCMALVFAMAVQP